MNAKEELTKLFMESYDQGFKDGLQTSLQIIKERRTWVGLTEQEHTDIAVECGCMSADWVFYGAAVERKLKQKNGFAEEKNT